MIIMIMYQMDIHALSGASFEIYQVFSSNIVYCVYKAVYTLTILPDARTVRERFASGCP